MVERKKNKYKKEGVKVRYLLVSQRAARILHEFTPPMDEDGRILWSEINGEDERENWPKANATQVIRPEWEKKHADRVMANFDKRRKGRRRKKKS